MSKKPGKSPTAKNIAPDEKTNPQVSIATISAIATVAVAVIGLIGTLAGLYFNYLQSNPKATPIHPTTSIPVTVLNSTPTIDINVTVPSATNLPENTSPTPILIAIATDTAVPTATSGLAVGMDVQLFVDTTSGKSPLKVTFDARDSFLRDTEGKIFNCSGGLCDYTWYVYQNSKLINKPESSHNGLFSYRFGNPGEYRVGVTVCRGQEEAECASDAEVITVR